MADDDYWYSVAKEYEDVLKLVKRTLDHLAAQGKGVGPITPNLKGEDARRIHKLITDVLKTK